MNPEVYIGDPSIKEPILISTIPPNPALANLYAGSVNANSQFNVLWTTYPDKPQLSLYNVHYTVRLGTNATGWEWPYGASILPTCTEYEISHHIDIVGTDYLRNRIYTVIAIKNNTGSPINFWCYFKTLTFATSMGVST